MPERSAVYDMLKAWCADFLASLAFLTRLPLPAGLPHVRLAQAMRAFPLVGALIGLATGALMAGLHSLGPPGLAAAGLTLAGLALLTGALHEDGLADVADGFGGGRDRAHKLDIMRDSRIGTYGVVAVGLVLLIRAACLADITASAWWVPICVMAAAGALSRALAVWLLATTDAARSDGLSSGVGRPASDVLLPALLIGVIIAGLLAYLAAGFFGALAIVLAGGAMAVIIRALAVQQIGGHTGDVCGALIIMSETAMLAAASIFA
jgi:adenosylcobinamide-GDP ribazoletransferase